MEPRARRDYDLGDRGFRRLYAAVILATLLVLLLIRLFSSWPF